MGLFKMSQQEKILQSLEKVIWKSIRIFLHWWWYVNINHLEEVSLIWLMFILVDFEWNSYHINWSNFIWFFEPKSNNYSFVRKKESIN